MNNHRHQPEVIARKLAAPILLNEYRREHYVEALETMGIAGCRSLSKVELFRRVRANPDAIKWLRDNKSWHATQQPL